MNLIGARIGSINVLAQVGENDMNDEKYYEDYSEQDTEVNTSNANVYLDGELVKLGDYLWSMRYNRWIEVKCVDHGFIRSDTFNWSSRWDKNGNFSYGCMEPGTSPSCQRDLYWDKVEVVIPPKPGTIFFYGKMLKVGDELYHQGLDENVIVHSLLNDSVFPLTVNRKNGEMLSPFTVRGNVVDHKNNRMLWWSKEEYEASLPKKSKRIMCKTDFDGKPFPYIKFKESDTNFFITAIGEYGIHFGYGSRYSFELLQKEAMYSYTREPDDWHKFEVEE